MLQILLEFSIIQKNIDTNSMNRLNPISLLLLFLTLTSVQSVRTTAVFVVSWLAGHCQYIQGKCDPNVINRWDHKSFTINGLWPSDQYFGEDYGRFNLDLLQKADFFNDMLLYWPPQPQKGGKPYFLWQLQWRDHGVGFGNIMLQQYAQKFSQSDITLQNQEIQLSYFKTCLSLYKNFNLTNMNTNLIKKSQLAVRMNISQKSFYLICTESGVLREIRICINFYETGAKAFECNRVNKFCNSAIVLKDWVNVSSKSELLQQQKKKVQIAIMQIAWKKNEAPEQKAKEIPVEQKAEIQFYEQEVSEEELKFSGISQRTNYALFAILVVLAVILVLLCVCYLRRQSMLRRISEKDELPTDNQFQISESQSKKENADGFAEP